MPPTVPFGNVNDFFALRKVVDKIEAQFFRMNRPNEGLRFFIDKIADRAGTSINFDHAETLMPAIGLFVGESPSVPVPAQLRETEIDAFSLRFDLFSLGNIKEIQLKA